MPDDAGAVLWWLPVGAGGRVVVHTSGWWESYSAWREHRRPAPLFHAALEVTAGDTRYVIEMAPAWGGPAGPRGVVATGPVGLRPLGALRSFRYEVRCWPNGVIPDLRWAVGGPIRLPMPGERARRVVDRVSEVPRLVWGRDEFAIGDMWNSNSLIAWLLLTSGVDVARLRPPGGGRAPGWRSGLAAGGDQGAAAGQM
ncbi:hypothetical protein MYK68_15675 [Gordonia sp. PP30]|uniref:hypothetical protein n=1 Tax=Gordonia sp. PP30 TaxID=2935861 RepID=UPI001FFF674A|nr:hypothetical protein [Gordonia sp. PP30]UQE74154.1 hypothetical protein MYK68_15675 [Gordonia sp. PP30]